jgi:hypothetical protein
MRVHLPDRHGCLVDLTRTRACLVRPESASRPVTRRKTYSRQVQQRHRPRTTPTTGQRTATCLNDLQRPRRREFASRGVLLSSMPSARHSKRAGSPDEALDGGFPHPPPSGSAVTHPGGRTCMRTGGPSPSRRTCPVKTPRSAARFVSAGSCATARSAGTNHLVRANRGERRRGSRAYIPWRVDAIVEPLPLAYGNHVFGDSCHRRHPDHRVCRRWWRRRLLGDQAVRPDWTALRRGQPSLSIGDERPGPVSDRFWRRPHPRRSREMGQTLAVAAQTTARLLVRVAWRSSLLTEPSPARH